MNYRTIADMNALILRRLYILPRDFDLIVGIPRSGMLPANLLSLYLNKPYTDLGSFMNGHIYKAGERGAFFDIKDYRRILVVDDSIGSGAAMQRCREQLQPFANDFDFSYCAIYVVPEKKNTVDYYFELAPLPRYFQWNILNHTVLEKCCFDIDGVLCVDPTEEQNDDGEKYREFLLNAPALFVPGCPIGTLVTSRLEKYRPETEAWLKRNNIRYNKLVMLDLPDMEARQRAANHAVFKAAEYKASDYVLFLESSPQQAVDINRLTGKPVLCTENFEMVFESRSLLYNIKRGESLPFIRRTLLPIRNFMRKLKNRVVK